MPPPSEGILIFWGVQKAALSGSIFGTEALKRQSRLWFCNVWNLESIVCKVAGSCYCFKLLNQCLDPRRKIQPYTYWSEIYSGFDQEEFSFKVLRALAMLGLGRPIFSCFAIEQGSWFSCLNSIRKVHFTFWFCTIGGF
jgi:hypothetical protein